MLLSLSVKNLALIENVEVSFGKGLNVFTGETGAGKSLVVGSMNLALGGRVKSGMVRDEKSPAEIEIVFSLDEGDSLQRIREMDIPVEEDGNVIIRRRIADGRTTAKVNGRTVTGSELREISSILIDVHAQSEHQSLLYEKQHLLFLDKFAGEEDREALEAYREKYDKWKSYLADLESMDRDENVRKREADLIGFEINEIMSAALKHGEDAELEDKFYLMNNSRKITEALFEASSDLSSENEGAAVKIARALRAISAVTEYGGGISKLYEELNEIDSLMGDLKRDMDAYYSELDFSPEEYGSVTDRLNLINDLKNKYGQSLDDIFEALNERQDRLELLTNYDEHLNNLKEKTEEARREMEKAAGVLSGIRKSAAIIMGNSMEEGLKSLNFDESRFEVCVEDTDSFGPDGKDRVYFTISTNLGEDLKPLKDVASGGELSRIMLALKTVLADMDDIGTMIFDEIDTGISGRTAQKVSESLLKLSREHQVILITHLPQIAAMADNHFLIEKKAENGRTKTEIANLERDEMISELGRMLSGASVTDAVMENAREMKDLADKKKDIKAGGEA
ncbi:MAG: DNA repair protein RecN [Lachnospiraceae bacterium]|nr:DNA repair protein RecN [Lachnospiraceae bacterium]